MVLVCLRLKSGAQVNLRSHFQVNQRSQSNMNYVIDEFQVAKTHAVKTQTATKKSAAETVSQRAGWKHTCLIQSRTAFIRITIIKKTHNLPSARIKIFLRPLILSESKKIYIFVTHVYSTGYVTYITSQIMTPSCSCNFHACVAFYVFFIYCLYYPY